MEVKKIKKKYIMMNTSYMVINLFVGVHALVVQVT